MRPTDHEDTRGNVADSGWPDRGHRISSRCGSDTHRISNFSSGGNMNEDALSKVYVDNASEVERGLERTEG